MIGEIGVGGNDVHDTIHELPLGVTVQGLGSASAVACETPKQKVPAATKRTAQSAIARTENNDTEERPIEHHVPMIAYAGKGT